MKAIRLSPSASITPMQDGVMLRSDLGAFRLDGPDVSLFMTTLLPLLDGSRGREEVAAALPTHSPESVLGFLALLERHGLLEEVADPGASGAERWLGQDAFFRKWSEQPAEPAARLRDAHVLVVGLEPWGVVLATELAAAGAGLVHVLDSSPVTPDDLLAVRLWTARHLGQPRSEALRGSLADIAPWCHLTTAPLPLEHAPPLSEGGRWDLVVTATRSDDLFTLQSVARIAHQNAIPSLYGTLDGLEAVVGPVVVPGQTACWNCYRLRRLAHAEHPEVTHDLQATLLATSPATRTRTYLAPTASLLGHLLALEAIQLLTNYTPSRLIGRVLVQHVVTLESSLHTVIRMPWCDVCGGSAATGGAAGGPVLDHRSEGAGSPPALSDLRQPEEVRAAFAGWVDEHSGVIRYLGLDPVEEIGPEVPIGSTAVLAAYTEGRAGLAGPEMGSGKGLTPAESLLSAIGEAIERYSASRYRVAALCRARLDELDGDVLDPRRLCLYTAPQYATPNFPFVPFRPEVPIHWLRGCWIGSDTPVWLPALPVYMHFPAPREEQFCQITSNGLAAGTDCADAALRATYELLERDAFMLTWLARHPVRHLALDATLEPGAHEVVRQLRAVGVNVELYLLAINVAVPTVVCIGFGDGRTWPGATVALAAHANPRVAARKAILEQGHVGPYIRRLMREGDHPIPPTPEDVHTLIDHALYYVPAERAEAFDFFRHGAATVRLGDLEEPKDATLAGCAAQLAASGLRVAIADVTAPDVAGSPFRVARALGPDIQPIDFGYAQRRLANPRLEALLSTGVNPYPHPLA